MLTLLPGLAFGRVTALFTGAASMIEPLFPSLRLQLKHADVKLSPAQFLAANLVSTIFTLILVLALALPSASALGSQSPMLVASLFAAFIALLVWTQNLAVPKAIIARKVLSIERNLIPALSDMLVQIHSGVPLFDILTNIGNADYGAVSSDFKRAVRRISAGESQAAVLEEMATGNPSIFSRRVTWQLVNALKTGASVSSVLSDAIARLGDEQVVQIQQYGGRLNSLTVFYLMTGVIIPALFMAGTVIVSFFITLNEFWTAISFSVAYLAVLFLQVLFFGLLRARRPNLL